MGHVHARFLVHTSEQSNAISLGNVIGFCAST